MKGYTDSIILTQAFLNRTYSFIYNHDTQKLTVSSYDPSSVNDVHLDGNLDLVLNDNSDQSNIATATTSVEVGVYGIKVFNYSKEHGGNFTIRDNGSKVLRTNYNACTWFIATGGTYTFSFNKTTGGLTVKKIS